MNSNIYSQQMLSALEPELQRRINAITSSGTSPLKEMLTYHMGWSGVGESTPQKGKRIRPLLLLLTCAAGNGDWNKALPAAAAVELVHNFSLIHDDIQDNSRLRHGRQSVWVRWGIPQAINAGDALYMLSVKSILSIAATFPPIVAQQALSLLADTCLELTRGQYLDMDFEKRSDITIRQYFRMVKGKTAALLCACFDLGALLGQANDNQREQYHLLGVNLGIAFQIHDDLLGIWGLENITGKSCDSDLLSYKVTLPALLGLHSSRAFRERWNNKTIVSDNIDEAVAMLEKEGIKDRIQQMESMRLRKSLAHLEKASPAGSAADELRELIGNLINRAA